MAAIFAELLSRAHWRYDPIDMRAFETNIEPAAVEAMAKLFGANIAVPRPQTRYLRDYDLVFSFQPFSISAVGLRPPFCTRKCEHCVRYLAQLAIDVAEERRGK